MLTEKLNEIFEEELQERIGDLQAKLKSKSDKLVKTEKLLEEQKEENEQFKKLVEQTETFQVFKGLVDIDNFEQVIRFFNLKNNNWHIDGMDSENIPKWFKLLFHYYEDKDRLFSLMDLFNIEYPSWAKDYVMPYEYSDEELELFIDSKYDRYITNGCIYDGNIGFFWRNVKHSKGDTMKMLTHRDSFLTCIPWQLILSNPKWQQSHMFNKIISTMKKKQNYSQYYFTIQNYNTLTKDQANEMAKLLPKNNFYEVHKTFIKNNKDIIKENQWLAEHFKDLISDNQFSSFYFLNYPLEMQKEFIRKRDKGYYSKFDLIKKMEIPKEEKITFLMEFAVEELQ